MNRPLERRAGPLFGALLVVVGAFAALTPVVPGALALDPTPDPGAGPTASPDPSASPDPAASADPSATPDPSGSPDPSASPPRTGGLSVDHFWVDMEDPSGAVASAGLLDDPRIGLTRFVVYRVRFHVSNDGPKAVRLTPTLMVGGGRAPQEWTAVPVEAAAAGQPFYVASDEGPTWRVRTKAIPARSLRLNPADDPAPTPTADPEPTPTADPEPVTDPEPTPTPVGDPEPVADPGPTPTADREPADPEPVTDPEPEPTPTADPEPTPTADPEPTPTPTPVDGLFSAGRNPAPGLTLPPGSATEVEFAVRATVDAAWESAYAFRLSLGDAPVAGQVDAVVSLGSAPPVVLSPGQREGVPVAAPRPAYPLKPPAGAIRTRLISATLPSSDSGSDPSAPGPFTSPHANYTLTTDSCGGCHSTHAAPGEQLLRAPMTPIADLCFLCHDGTGADSNILNQFSAAPPNDPLTASYYSHPATVASAHTSDDVEEFAGVHNRHSVCTDCHQAHNADSTLTTSTTSGWTAGGAIRGASGVAVTNGAADTVPTFTWQPRATYEYQLCFKCHSGYTVLNAQEPGFPSRWALDKSVELNPANLSYHPVEAAGRNTTSQMTASLAGTSPYKLWTFTTESVIRCQNCHGPGTFANPAPDAQIDSHASPNRGILLRNYRDRELKPAGQGYAAADFALCYLCHAEAPMVDTSGDQRDDTNFRFHGYHVSLIANKGSSTDRGIDTDGAGAGNAVCAECHFRIHGSSFPVDGQAPASRLVNFAPNIQAFGGQIGFVLRVGGTQGSCTLTCHGKDHDPKGY